LIKMISIEAKNPKSSLAAALERAKVEKRSYHRSNQHTVKRANHSKNSWNKNERSLDYTPKQITKSSLAVAVAIAAKRTKDLQSSPVKQGNDVKTTNFSRKNLKFVDRNAKQARSHGSNVSALPKQKNRERGLVASGDRKKQGVTAGSNRKIFCSGQSGRTGRGRRRNANRGTGYRNDERFSKQGGGCGGEKGTEKKSKEVTDANANNIKEQRGISDTKYHNEMPDRLQNFEDCATNVQHMRINIEIMNHSSSEIISEVNTSKVIPVKVAPSCELSPIRGRWADESDGDY